ncbi:hypothetical protein KVR01_008995 [Diaporthe batatas]|uniref:uncharacterized protein n=1 Tax=Diaporthe batatas TaxID=748121 RepID=UPI001D053D87|nr:uncharacterized protein KVR01_008995 [Diaporthe batatas]KAG8160731.1 hypothetical protein KVR01_008995 [Diaporthe batatas]
MLKSLFLAVLSASAAVSVAIPVEPVVEPTVETVAVPQVKAAAADCVYTCGSVCYWQVDINDALAAGYSNYKSGSAPGGYPHQYNNYEGFSFPTAAPWYEFPILSSYKVYTGGSPGADRVVFDSKGKLDALITHTGASGNNFVACKKA